MPQSIAAVALVVPDYDEAIAWYTGVLGFELVEDRPLGGGKRWVRVAGRAARIAGPLPAARACGDSGAA